MSQAHVLPYIDKVNLPEGGGISAIFKVAENPDHITINFRHDNDDVPFHLDIRMKDNVVVRNTMIKNKWGEEERGGGNPFTSGALIELVIFIEREHYKIIVNGKQFATFRHRVGISTIRTVEVQGTLVLLDFHYFEKCHTRNKQDILPGYVEGDGAYYVIPSDGSGLYKGAVIKIEAHIRKRAGVFKLCIGSRHSNDHLIAIWDSFLDDKPMTISDRHNGRPGDVQNISAMKFKRGENFKLDFTIGGDSVTITKSDGQRTEYRFNKNVDLSKFNMLVFKGQVTITQVMA